MIVKVRIFLGNSRVLCECRCYIKSGGGMGDGLRFIFFIKSKFSILKEKVFLKIVWALCYIFNKCFWERGCRFRVLVIVVRIDI